jgi:hypothetical protein
LIGGDPDLVQDAIHEERDWFASAGIEVSGTDRSQKPVQHLLPNICLTSPPVSDDLLSPDRTRLRQRTRRAHQWPGYGKHGAVLLSRIRLDPKLQEALHLPAIADLLHGNVRSIV